MDSSSFLTVMMKLIWNEDRDCLCWMQVRQKASSHGAERKRNCHGSQQAAGIYSLPLLAGEAARKPLMLAGMYFGPVCFAPLRIELGPQPHCNSRVDSVNATSDMQALVGAGALL